MIKREPQLKKKKRSNVIGKVISDKMDKTISVEFSRTFKHIKYGKFIKRTSFFKAHDEKNDAKLGDIVCIEETRPISRTKRWKLKEILKKGQDQEAVVL